MSFLDHIARCNAHDLSKFVPFSAAGERVGYVRRDNAAQLARFPETFRVASDGVTLAPELDGYAARADAVAAVVRTLAEEGAIAALRNELYPVGGGLGGPHALEIDRAAAPFFGIRAYGVHVNGFTRRGGETMMWIGVRADDRPVCPGELDNMVAGGQPVGLGLLENVIKEAAEEACIPEELARRAVPVGAVSYAMEDAPGLRPDMMLCWDLELPPDFAPANADGEIAEFRLLPAAEVMEIVDTGFAFKFNCNLVNIDFFVRHGLLRPTHPDYEEIVLGLRR